MRMGIRCLNWTLVYLSLVPVMVEIHRLEVEVSLNLLLVIVVAVVAVVAVVVVESVFYLIRFEKMI